MSTSIAVMNNLQYAYENLDNGNIVMSLFLDFSKIFDCILDLSLLFDKLRRYEVRGVPFDWFKSNMFLSQHSLYVGIVYVSVILIQAP